MTYTEKLNSLDIIDTIICALRQSDAFDSLLFTDPGIQATQETLRELTNKARQHLPKSLANELEEAITSYVCAHIDPCILFGMKVSESLKEASAAPSQYSAYICKLRKEGQA
ncbi:MAG: hypothetical protein IKB65_01100 [Ruminiclostridium sp.]|nr:hypothetical protein [Ruminiclostridium sp.]